MRNCIGQQQLRHTNTEITKVSSFAPTFFTYQLDMPNVKLSKLLSFVLRHDNLGLEIGNDGYININQLLKHSKFNKFTLQDIIQVVNDCPKQRFNLEDRQGNLYIRANQGHSLHVNVKMTLLTIAPPIVVHGTNIDAFRIIKTQGLSRMNRQHIHFAKGLPSDGLKSGMRSDCQVYIYINAAKAMKDGIEFYESENQVILTAGKDGILSAEYFDRVTDNQGNPL